MNVTQYLDLQQAWVYELSGGVFIFVILGLIAIWYISIKAKLDFQLSLLFSILFTGICFSIAYSELLIIWAFDVLVAGFLFYYGVSKLMVK